jgi:DNA-binding beta-propeller fold protein YncE
MKFKRLSWIGASVCLVAQAALAKPYILATGRRDPRIYAIDVEKALKPENNGTSNAVVSRSWVQPRRLDGVLLGDPANILLSEDGTKAYVMNHHGAIANAEFLQHGGRASISVLDLRKMVSRRFDDSDAALERNYDAGWFGGVGLVQHGGRLVVSYSEGWLSEDGSNRIGIIDLRTGGLVNQIELPLVGPGTRQLTTGCPAFPVPFVSPTPPPVVPFLSVDPAFGCWTDPEGITFVNGSDGKTYLVSGNAGTEDISIMDWAAAEAGQRVVEVAPRIPMQTGTFAIKASPNGKFVALPARESNRFDFEGNTVTIVDVDKFRQGLPGAEAARVQVGVDDPAAPARPHWVEWTRDGQSILVANFRSNNVSIIDLAKALAHDPGAETARIPLTRPDGQPARPKGVALTHDGRYLVVSGGARQVPTAPPSGNVHIIDLRTNAVVATVTGIGNDPYGLTVADVDGGD